MTLSHLGLGWWTIGLVFAVPVVLLAATVLAPGRPGRRVPAALGAVVLAQVVGVLVLALDGNGNDPQAWRVWRWFLGTAAVCWLLGAWLTLDIVVGGVVRGRRAAGSGSNPGGHPIDEPTSDADHGPGSSGV